MSEVGGVALSRQLIHIPLLPLYFFFFFVIIFAALLSLNKSAARANNDGGSSSIFSVILFFFPPPFVFCFSFYRNVCSHLAAERTRHTLSSNFKWMSFSQKREIHSFKVALREKIAAVCLTLCCHLDIFLKCFDDILQIARCL